MRNTSLVLFIFFISFNLLAHEGGHGYASQVWTINEHPIKGEFVKYDGDKVFLINLDHKIIEYNLNSFSEAEQTRILKTNQKLVSLNEIESTPSKNIILGYLIGSLVVFLSMIRYFLRKEKSHLAYGIFGFALILFTACNKGNTVQVITTPIPANNLSYLNSIFSKFQEVTTSSDEDWFYISSNGLPSHNMMVGITNWQQQVPIDQDYIGTNSWSIPLQPELSDEPLSTKTNLLKGAIAIAVNGIPIFNPLNNRGEDANQIGELDQWGGHCGRADDYHYHLPPTHLQSIVGEDNPIAYAVDGFPVYGETTEELDEYLGRFNENDSYQYHTILEYPYLIAGMRGKVTLDPNTTAPENQVFPQATTRGIRPATEPLNGAEITDFISNSESSYSLTYTLNGETYKINYSWNDNRLYTYEFISPDGSKTVETYQR